MSAFAWISTSLQLVAALFLVRRWYYLPVFLLYALLGLVPTGFFLFTNGNLVVWTKLAPWFIPLKVFVALEACRQLMVYGTDAKEYRPAMRFAVLMGCLAAVLCGFVLPDFRRTLSAGTSGARFLTHCWCAGALLAAMWYMRRKGDRKLRDHVALLAFYFLVMVIADFAAKAQWWTSNTSVWIVHSILWFAWALTFRALPGGRQSCSKYLPNGRSSLPCGGDSPAHRLQSR